MRIFEMRQVREARAYSMAGGQALHCHRIMMKPGPGCFRRDVDAGKEIAHLFDQDKARLIATARRLGVRVILVEREGTERQHVDLCGRPLGRARAEAVTGGESIVASWFGEGGR